MLYTAGFTLSASFLVHCLPLSPPSFSPSLCLFLSLASLISLDLLPLCLSLPQQDKDKRFQHPAVTGSDMTVTS